MAKLIKKNEPFNKRLSYAFRGLLAIWQKEASFRIQIALSLGLLFFCLAVRPPAIWCGLFTCAVITVLTLEIVNTAFESLLDKFHPEYDPQVGFIKDCLAGAVLVASIGSVLIFIFYLRTEFALESIDQLFGLH
ncbi:MAG: diacylglycerol kinase [Bdellovibrionaceae bacterium]|nr:diacylglycerol kinase [Bdellovibrio sp.]